VEQIDFEICHFHNSWTSVTLTLTLAWVIWHTVVYHYISNFFEIGKTFCGQWREVSKYGWMDIENGFIY